MLNNGAAARASHRLHADHRAVAAALGDQRRDRDVEAALASQAVTKKPMTVVDELLPCVEDDGVEIGMTASFFRTIPRRRRLFPDPRGWSARAVSHFGGTTVIAALWMIPGAACHMSTAERRRALNWEE